MPRDIDKFIELCQKKIDRKITGYIVPFPAGDILYIKLYRFIIEKQEVNYLRSRTRTLKDIWDNYIRPMRKRVGVIRHPVSRSHRRDIDKIAKTMA